MSEEPGGLMSSTTRLRVLFGVAGALLLAYGLKILIPLLGRNHPVSLAKWLIATVVIHDGVLVPATMALGWLLTVAIRPRARRYVQGFLISSALVTAVTLPMIHRRGRSAPGLALLQQDYALHLFWVIVAIGVVTAMGYAVRVLRDRTSSAKTRPSADHVSPTS